MNVKTIFRFPHAGMAMIVASLVVPAMIPRLDGATRDWAPPVGPAGSAAWSLPANWGGTAPANNLTDDIARFYQTSYNFQPSAGSGTQVGGLVFGNSTAAVNITTASTQGGRFSLGGSGLLMEATSGAVSLGVANNQGVNLGANQTWTNDSSSLLTVYRVDNLTNTTPYALTIAGSGSGGVELRQVTDHNTESGSPGSVSLVINTSGAGVTTLTGGNAHTGDTTLTSGVLALNNSGALLNSALDTAGTGTVTTNVTTLTFGGLKGSRNISSVITSGYGSVTALSLNPLSGTSSYSGVISNGAGATSLTKAGAGTQVLEGANSYTGATAINAGILGVTSLANGGVASGLGSADTTASNLAFNGGTLQLTGTTTSAQSTNRLFRLGPNGGTLDSSAGIGSSMNFTNTGNTTTTSAGSRTLTLTGTRDGSVASAIGQLDLLNPTSVVKSGAGTWTLSGNNPYTGTTTVNEGTLRINGSVGVGGVTVNSGGTLGGSGTVSGLVTVNQGGTLSPGTSPGIATYSGGLTLETGSNFTFELNADTVANRGGSYDGVNVTGAGVLTLESGVNFNLVLNGSGSTTNYASSFWDTDQSWLVFDNTNVPSIAALFTLGSVSNDSFDNTFASTGGTFSFAQVDNDIYLNYTAIPEPTTVLLLAGAVAVLVTMRSRRRI